MGPTMRSALQASRFDDREMKEFPGGGMIAIPWDPVTGRDGLGGGRAEQLDSAGGDVVPGAVVMPPRPPPVLHRTRRPMGTRSSSSPGGQGPWRLGGGVPPMRALNPSA